jgi:hypothetical protein
LSPLSGLSHYLRNSISNFYLYLLGSYSSLAGNRKLDTCLNILRRAKEEGEDVYKKALEIVNEGESWGFLRLEDFEKRVEVDGRI